jgi:hypothetical protein
VSFCVVALSLSYRRTRMHLSTVEPVNSTLNNTKPVNSNRTFGTGFAFPYGNVHLNSTSLQVALLFLLSQGYVLFAGLTVLDYAGDFLAFCGCVNELFLFVFNSYS